MSWDSEADLVVIGSGGGGLTAALAGRAAGLDAVVLEKTDRLGGATAMSGGALWIPNNALMRAEGVPDSEEDALAYLGATVGDRTSAERQRAYVRDAPRMLDFLLAEGLRFSRCPGYPDYFPERPGGHVLGRTVEAAAFSGRRLGDLHAHVRTGGASSSGVAVTATEARSLLVARGSVRHAWLAARALARVGLAALLGRRSMTMGRSLVGQLLLALRRRGVEVRRGVRLIEVVVEGARAVGVVVEANGRVERVGARRGVVLAAGGFARDDVMRARHHPSPSLAAWTSTHEGDTGDAIRAGVDRGAATDLLDDAWWGPSSVLPDGTVAFHVNERSLPGALMVDTAGRRYTNESAPYTEVVHAMHAHHREVPCVPSFFVMDAWHRGRYLLGMVPFGRPPRKLVDGGYLLVGRTLAELGRSCGLPDGALEATVARFNAMAAAGVDEDFHRGASAYDRYYGDPSVRPNPCLRPLATPPFYAVRLVPGDLGTKGGLLTDEHARVLREAGGVIDGLYAVGNTSASVFGHTYPGAGATLGPALTFGWAAARHAAARG